MSRSEAEKKIWDSFEAMWNEQPYADDPEFDPWFASLTKVQQIVFPTQWLCSEVCNGGFHQYFTNSTGHHAPEAVTGFRELGLEDISEIVQSAIDIFGRKFPRLRQDRESFLAKFGGETESEWNPFHRLDDKFFETLKIPGAPPLAGEDRFTRALNELIANSV